MIEKNALSEHLGCAGNLFPLFLASSASRLNAAAAPPSLSLPSYSPIKCHPYTEDSQLLDTSHSYDMSGPMQAKLTSATRIRFSLSPLVISLLHVEIANGSNPGAIFSLAMSGRYTTPIPSRCRSAASSMSSSRDEPAEERDEPIQTSQVLIGDVHMSAEVLVVAGRSHLSIRERI